MSKLIVIMSILSRSHQHKKSKTYFWHNVFVLPQQEILGNLEKGLNDLAKNGFSINFVTKLGHGIPLGYFFILQERLYSRLLTFRPERSLI